jgi:hypothetical protein
MPKSTNLKTVKKIQAKINLYGTRLGLTLLSFKAPVFRASSYFNADRALVQLNNAINMTRKMSVRHSFNVRVQPTIKKIAAKVGFGIDSLVALAGPLGLATASVLATSFTVNWTAYAGATDYQVIIIRTSDGAVINTYTPATNTQAVTGLVTATNYTIKVRARWNSATEYTDYSVITQTTA